MKIKDTTRHNRTINILFPLSLLIAFSASLAGILSDTVYSRELPSAAVQFVSRDFIILIGILPFSIITFLYRLKDTMWARTSLLGISLHLLVTFGFNLFSLHVNAMFFLYGAVAGLSLFIILIEFPSLSAEIGEPADFAGKRIVSIALSYLAVSVLQFWFGDILPALIYRQVPVSMKYLHGAVNAAAVFDLCFMVPFMVIGALYIWRGKPKGLVIAAAAFVRLLLSRVSGITMEVGLLGAGMEHNGTAIVAYGFDIVISISMLILMIRKKVFGGMGEEKIREKHRNGSVTEQAAY